MCRTCALYKSCPCPVHTTDLIREPEQIGVRVVGEHAVDRVHQLLQQQEEELLGDPACINSLLPVKDDLQARGKHIQV